MECRGQQIPMGILIKKTCIIRQLRGMSTTNSEGIGFGELKFFHEFNSLFGNAFTIALVLKIV